MTSCPAVAHVLKSAVQVIELEGAGQGRRGNVRYSRIRKTVQYSRKARDETSGFEQLQCCTKLDEIVR